MKRPSRQYGQNDTPHRTKQSAARSRGLTRSTGRSPLLGVAYWMALFLCSNAWAQSNAIDDPFAGVEEMIVTGSSTAALLAPSNTAAVAFDTVSCSRVRHDAATPNSRLACELNMEAPEKQAAFGASSEWFGDESKKGKKKHTAT